jgi:hypothetical protein
VFSCTPTCVEVYLEKGLTKVIQLSMVNLKHIQPMDYKQFPFKCKSRDEY